MRAREKIKYAHETAVIETFINRLNFKTSKDFKIIDRPNPPDAILQSGNIYLWVEHADIYRNAEEAREECSIVTPGETPRYHSEHPIVEPDERITISFIAILHKKLMKESYREPFKKFGPGILILTEQDPGFDESTMECIQDKLVGYDFSGVRRYFKEAYLGYDSMGNLLFQRVYSLNWLYRILFYSRVVRYLLVYLGL